MNKTLKQIREGKQLSLRETARLAGLSYVLYACIEQGTVVPTPADCIVIGYALDVDPTIIIQMFIF